VREPEELADTQVLREALEALPAEFREAFVLRELEGCSYKEIANITDVPLGTVMSRLARAHATAAVSGRAHDGRGVMLSCEQTRPLLSAYFDRELDVAKSLEIEGHLRECTRCAAVVQQHEALHGAVSAAALVFAPPRDLEWRLRKAVRREAKPRSLSVLRPWRWAALPAAATLLVAFSWSMALNRGGPSADDLLLAELVSGHVRSLQVVHLVDVTTSDQHTVKPWFNGKVDFAPPVADFKASGFPLVGGRVDYVAGRPTAVLVYTRNQHIVNVFIWPAGKGEGQARRNATYQGYHLSRWSESGLTCWAVSDVNSTDMETLAHLFLEAG